MAGELDGFEVGVPCPDCGHETQKSFGWLKSNNQMTCGGCGKPIDLNDAGFRKGIADAERSIDEFRKGLK